MSLLSIELDIMQFADGIVLLAKNTSEYGRIMKADAVWTIYS